jgi:hypothetical protein
MSKKSIELENWSIVYIDPWKAPELQEPLLHGNVYGHPKFMDGEEITTSQVVGFDKSTNIITTYSGHKYKLGKVDSLYEKEFPDAYNRVIKSLGSKFSK